MDHMISVGQDQLWVDDSTTGPGDERPVVVLLHPGIYDSSVWDPVLPLLTDLRVVRFDQRGFGASPLATTEYTALDDLLSVLDDRGLDRVHLAGNSMGGAAALSLALEHPERVASLTLLAPGIQGYPWPEETPDPEEEKLQADYDRLSKARDAEGLADLLVGVWCRAGADDAVRQQLVRSSAADFVQDDLQRPNPEQWSRLPGLDVPTSVVVGGRDEPSATQAGTDLAGRIPGATLLRVAEADHLIGLRAPETVAAAIHETIGRAGQRGRG
jgi:pimeloyl-ACP methyl ester carboxylesterase